MRNISIGELVVILLVMNIAILLLVLIKSYADIEIEISDCKISNVINFTCTDGKSGVVKEDNYLYVSNNSNCTVLNKNLRCV